MSLFRRLFPKNRKPPDRLLEISDRVYVFNCCFSTEVLEEDKYKVYMGGIVAELQDYYRDSSFMVFNFREGDRRTHISNILSPYGMTVMEFPRQYEGYPVLPLEMIYHFLTTSVSWLSLGGQQNVLLMHCESGGWPMLAFMLAALTVFRKQYSSEQMTLEMVYKRAPRELHRLLTPLNPQPSQLRYLQYISRRNFGSDWPPSDTPLALDLIILRFLPLLSGKGCRPVIRIYGQDSSSTTANRESKLLFTSSKTEKQARYYQPEECELVTIDIHHRVQGDVVLECIHLDHVREDMIFRVMFHTTFVRNSVLDLSRDEVDVMWDARDQMPMNFKAEVCFSDADVLPSMITTRGEFKDENRTENPIDVEFIGIDEIFSFVLAAEDDDISAPFLKEESESESENGDIRVPFVKEFEHLKIQLEDIKSATDNFGENKLIGIGGFGKVYRGEVYHSNGKSMAAFKRLDPRYGQGDPEFWKEILMLSAYKHKNLISLLGFCNEGREKILVYEYASNGSLDRHLSSTHLTWRQRIKICVDAARGLSCLHDDKGTMQRVIHRDIKSSNILLDDDWNAKVSDLGLSKIGPANQMHTFLITNIAGTPGYCDPQYMNLFTLSKESDIYSFGVILFEVLCGRLCYTYSNGKLDKILVPTWKKAYIDKKLHEIVFRDLMQPIDSTSLEIYSAIAFQCLHEYREDRPTIAHVVQKLEIALEFESQKPLDKYEDGLTDVASSLIYRTNKSTFPRPMSGSLWADFQRHEEPQSEFDASEVETLFRARVLTKDTFEGGQHGSELEKVRLVDSRRAHNMEIMLGKAKTTLPNMMAAALAMDDSILDADQIKNLIKFCPTKEEMELLESYTGDTEMLGECEQFFVELMKVPRMESKLCVFLFKIQFNAQLSELRKSLNTVNSATAEVKKSVKLREIMKRSFYLWNTLNKGTHIGSEVGFKLDSLLKFTDTQSSNRKTTLMHYLCKVLASKSPELLDFDMDLVSLESATKIQLKSLAEEMQAISKGMEKVEQELYASAGDGPVSQVFHKKLNKFLRFAELEVRHLISLYAEMGRNADSLSKYFGEDPARYPFEQATRTLFNFVRLFQKAHEENYKQAELVKIESSIKG